MAKLTSLEGLDSDMDKLEESYNLLFKDFAIMNSRLEALVDRAKRAENVLDRQIKLLEECCEENKRSLQKIQMTEANIKNVLSLVKWIIGLLTTILPIGIYLIYGVKL